MPERKNPVVASLGSRSPHPYTSITLSPNRRYAIVARKDTLRLLAVGPNGLSLLRSLQISQVGNIVGFVDVSGSFHVIHLILFG